MLKLTYSDILKDQELLMPALNGGTAGQALNGNNAGQNMSFLPTDTNPLTGITNIPSWNNRVNELPATVVTGTSDISVSKPTVPGNEVSGVPKANADSFVVGGNKSDIQENTIKTPAFSNGPHVTYTDIVNSGVTSSIKNAGSNTPDQYTPPPAQNKPSTDNAPAGNNTPALPMSFEEYILSLKSNADDAYKKRVEQAELERRRSVVDAGNAYSHNRSAYGSNAEALSAMGLTGSGYSDYLDSKAYAQMRGDINAANRTKQSAVDNAESVRADTYAKADATYMDYLNQKETNRNNAYATLYNAINQTTTEADIDNLGKAYGLTEEQIASLKAARKERTSAWLNENAYDKETLDQLFPEGGDLYQQYYNNLITEAKDVVSANMFDGVDKDSASATYSSVKNVIQSQIDNTTNPTEKKKLQDTLSQLENAYNDAYNSPASVSSSIKFNANNLAAGLPFFDGDRFTITDSDGTKYVVESTGAETPKEVEDFVARNDKITDGTVFKYGNQYYVRVGDKIHQFRARYGQSDQWKNFEKKFNEEFNAEE